VVSRLRAPSVVGVLGSLFVLAIVFWLVVNLIKNPSDFFEVTSIGVTNGCVYALVALGYTLVYGILELINFATATCSCSAACSRSPTPTTSSG
jgi:branched-chain amino acid transport system permease protein